MQETTGQTSMAIRRSAKVVQHARDIFRSLTGGPAHVVTERIIQDALETRIAAVVAARGDVPAMTPTFVPRFVASTLLTLIA
jgi:hypothetical protein